MIADYYCNADCALNFVVTGALLGALLGVLLILWKLMKSGL